MIVLVMIGAELLGRQDPTLCRLLSGKILSIASEFTYSKLLSHSGRTECSEGAPAALKGGLKLSLPMSFGLAASLMSRFTTAGE
jgi:hypothetical protein